MITEKQKTDLIKWYMGIDLHNHNGSEYFYEQYVGIQSILFGIVRYYYRDGIEMKTLFDSEEAILNYYGKENTTITKD